MHVAKVVKSNMVCLIAGGGAHFLIEMQLKINNSNTTTLE